MRTLCWLTSFLKSGREMTINKRIMTPKPFSQTKLFLVLVFLSGLASGFILPSVRLLNEKNAPVFQLNRLYRDSTGHLVNPLMQVEGPAGHDPRLESMKRQVQSYVNRQIKKNEVAEVSVYLRNLNQGTWVGINEDERYTAASLAKVPYLFALYLKAQQDPSVLDRQIKYETPLNIPFIQNTPPQHTLQLGQIYSVEELLKNMIASSDNLSRELLYKSGLVDSQLAGQIYSDLALPLLDESAEYYISTKEYAQFFRLLYSASYLNKDLSEKALKLLAEVDFKDGIVAGVPKNIVVAHKFGERGDGLGGMQLHDCGIAYYPKTPYLICIMTKGWDNGHLKSILSKIAEIVSSQAIPSS